MEVIKKDLEETLRNLLGTWDYRVENVSIRFHVSTKTNPHVLSMSLSPIPIGLRYHVFLNLTLVSIQRENKCYRLQVLRLVLTARDVGWFWEGIPKRMKACIGT